MPFGESHSLPPSGPAVSVVRPVYNEAHVLAQTVATVTALLDIHFPAQYELIIANNASTDGTLALAEKLAAAYSPVRVLHLDEKGRGRAIKRAWSESAADMLSYMDVDLSADLTAFPELIRPLAERRYDLAIGSRLLKPELTNRSIRREAISRGYNLLVKALFNTRFSDAQCGFKAIARAAATRLLPLVEDNGWFMDTELLVIAEKLGYRIFDLPVAWVEDPDSRVKIWRTALEDIRGMIRVKKNLTRGKHL